MSMRGDRRQRREQLAELQVAAIADVTCNSCGGVYEGSAYQVHREDLGRGRIECLPGDARGQLVKLGGGRWGQRWRHPGIRS